MTRNKKETSGAATPEEEEAFAWWQERQMNRVMRRRYRRALIAYRLSKLSKEHLVHPILLVRLLFQTLR